MDEISIKAGCSKVLELLNGTGLDYTINNAAIVRSFCCARFCRLYDDSCTAESRQRLRV
jgi:hypothetical protein